MTNQPITIHSRDVPRHGHSPPTPESSSSSLGSSSIRIQDGPQADGAAHLDEDDYIAVQASACLLHLDPELNYQVAEGYINSSSKIFSCYFFLRIQFIDLFNCCSRYIRHQLLRRATLP
jgi:hypothetical protein